MRRIPWPLAVAVALAGCRHPIPVTTQSRLTVDGPVETTARVMLDPSPVGKADPVTAMPLPGPPAPCQGPRVALLDVDGLLLNTDFTGPYSLGENPVALFREKLEAIAADPRVRAVVLRVNSPGGSVTASDVMLHELKQFRARTGRPVVACLLDVGAGGAYYLATGADAVLAHPTAITGGMGVVLNLYNLSDAMGFFNVVPQPVKSGAYIDMGSSLANLSDEVKEMLQGMADEFHTRYRQQVECARPRLDPGKGPLFDGRVFTARQALERGLIDQVGYLEDAVGLARQLGKCEQAEVAIYHRRNDPARSWYATTPNVPLQATAVPASLPGLERSKLPSFLYLWQPEATYERLSGK